MTASIWGCRLVEPPDWLEMMPQIPLAAGLPVVMGHGRYQGDRAVICRCSDDLDVIVLWDGQQLVHQELAGALRVDLSDPQGQRYAACVYLHGLPQHEADAIRRACPWLEACLLGEGSDADLYELAVALEGAPPRPEVLMLGNICPSGVVFELATPVIRPALRPRVSDTALAGLVATLATATIVLWASTAAVVAASLLSIL